MKVNPDVEELQARNRATCNHPLEWWDKRTVAMGSGRPDVYGCLMETKVYCGCGAELGPDALIAMARVTL